MPGLVISHIPINVLISAISLCISTLLFNVQYTDPYVIVGLTTVLKNFPFTFFNGNLFCHTIFPFLS